MSLRRRRQEEKIRGCFAPCVVADTLQHVTRLATVPIPPQLHGHSSDIDWRQRWQPLSILMRVDAGCANAKVLEP